jgi:hypothetical protein
MAAVNHGGVPVPDWFAEVPDWSAVVPDWSGPLLTDESVVITISFADKPLS